MTDALALVAYLTAGGIGAGVAAWLERALGLRVTSDPLISATWALAPLLAGITWWSGAGIGWTLPLVVLLVAVAIVDARHGVVPDLLSFAVLALAMAFAITGEATWSRFIAGAFALAVTLPLALLPRRQPILGGADVILIAAAGLWLGAPGLLIMLVWTLILAVTETAALLSGGYGIRFVRLGPCLAIGWLVN